MRLVFAWYEGIGLANLSKIRYTDFMKIQRIEQNDPRFSSKAIECHMAFCVDDNCIEFELIDRDTAVIHTMNDHGLDEAIEELRFYAGHISVILDEKGNVYKSYPKSLFFLLDIDL